MPSSLSFSSEMTSKPPRLKRQQSWPGDVPLPQAEKKAPPLVSQPTIFKTLVAHFCFLRCCLSRPPSSSREKKAARATRPAHKPHGRSSTASTRPFPSLVFRAAPSERTPCAVQQPSRARLRYCVVASRDGLGEMIQHIVVSATALYVYHLGRRDACSLLTIYPHPGGRVYVVDLGALGRMELEERQSLCLEQTRIAQDAETRDGVVCWGALDMQQQQQQQQRRRQGDEALDADGHSRRRQLLPSLRDLLENAAVPKIAFDARATVEGLRARCGFAVRGMRDVQLMEVAGRRRQGAAGTRGGKARLRDLRMCLE